MRRFTCCLLLSAIATFGCQAKLAEPTAATSPSAGNKPPANAAETPVAVPPLEETSTDDAAFELEPNFTQLNREQFEAFHAEPETWKSTSSGISSTGKPKGYLYSKETYHNFTWRLDYRFPRPAKLKDDLKFNGNTGFLVYITGEHKQWPVCLEVQGKYLQMAAIKENGGAQPVATEEDDIVRQKVRRPVGQWNSLEITSKDGALRVALNGALVSNSQPNFLSEGLIGIQAEDHPFDIRRMRIRRD